MSIGRDNTFAVMISHNGHHTLLPWTYSNKEAAITDADNLASCLEEHGFTDRPQSDNPSFDWPEKGGPIVEV
jgi:hypothetical protein